MGYYKHTAFGHLSSVWVIVVHILHFVLRLADCKVNILRAALGSLALLGSCVATTLTDLTSIFGMLNIKIS